ncbi:hypothetical protein [Pyxidicoccus trucidator]|uniref:hypothetical protein n=1 Tax=Pyxidicoccus trucidator TaxID=2709662 RepID=UPI0013D99EC0|nr:hypothetical protein [Pyxidicoccus trucidator]
MTSGRFAPLGAAVLTLGLTLATSGCGDGATPCTECPAIEGRYRMDFGDAGAPDDCGTLGVDLPRGQPLDITRSGADLAGTLQGVSLRGTVSGQGSFSLSGNAAGSPDGGVTQSLSLSGLYTPPILDGGTARLAGNYSGNFSRAGPNGPQRCNVITPFSATRP